MHRNRLAAETSPYLLQHADNPVDWYAWGDEAIGKARRENKPILLSVGYSACHWCHVMAHESFEDPATAALMNELFVNIKVDREERPDLDKIYQVAQQLLTQRSGGWPLTMFLTPDDQQPFFGGTYFPKEPRYGMPAFADLLRRVADFYHGHGAEIRSQGEQLESAFAQLVPHGASPEIVLEPAPLARAQAELEQSFDAELGGFGRAPKFPSAGSIERCLRHWHASGAGAASDLKALHMATLTLTRMAEGGLYDQLGGGFSRYSVDAAWMIPHFEKMLYDNGALLAVYAQAALATGEPLFARIAAETAAWALRDMRAAGGGFYSSLDADSEGHEGKFYMWHPNEVAAHLSAEQFAAFSRRFGLDGAANFEGAWHLHTRASQDEIARALGASKQTVTALIDTARAQLLIVRDARVWPARDEKILTAWNALMIKGLAIAGRVLNRPDFTDAAQRAADFIRTQLWQDGRLLASYKDGKARFAAYLDDHAFLADALLELLQTRWRACDFAFLIELTETMLDRFEDAGGGGFFFTASDHERLIHRSKTFADESVPAGNGIAAGVLCRLGTLLGESRYLRAATRTLTAAWPALCRYPQAHMSLLNALEDLVGSLKIVIVRGSEVEAAHWLRELERSYAPTRLQFAIPADESGLPPALAAKRAASSTVAYVCTGMSCSEPMTDLRLITRGLAAGAS